jgi:hypothetical protein
MSASASSNTATNSYLTHLAITGGITAGSVYGLGFYRGAANLPFSLQVGAIALIATWFADKYHPIQYLQTDIGKYA